MTRFLRLTRGGRPILIAVAHVVRVSPSALGGAVFTLSAGPEAGMVVVEESFEHVVALLESEASRA